jgi:large conductance mechanosensitive channel
VGPKGFANSYIPLSDAVAEARAGNPNLSLEEARKVGNVLAWGNFLTNIIDFLLLALIVFIIIKALNKLRPPLTKVVEVVS